MAVCSLIFMLPFFLLFSIIPGPNAADGVAISITPFLSMVIIMPLLQACFGYIFVRLGAWVYNKVSPRIGGFEFCLEELGTEKNSDKIDT